MARADDRDQRAADRAARERAAKDAADMEKKRKQQAAADAKKRQDDAAKARIAKRTPLHTKDTRGHKGGQGAHAKPSPWSLKRKG